MIIPCNNEYYDDVIAVWIKRTPDQRDPETTVV